MARATCVIAIAAAAVSFAAAVRAESAPVKPGTLVEVSFSAAVEKGPNVEDDPSLAELLPISAGRQSKTGAKFMAARWDFLSADGKAMLHPRSGWTTFTLSSKKPKQFRFRVYVPEGAAKIAVVGQTLGKDEKVRVEGLRVEERTPGEVLNPNPDFSATGDELASWQLAGAARYLKDGEGRRYAFAEDGAVFGDMFPVTGGRKLEVKFTGAPPKYATRQHIPWVAVHFYDEYSDALRPNQQFARPRLELRSQWGREATKSHVYDIPDGAKWCRLVVRCGSATLCEARMK